MENYSIIFIFLVKTTTNGLCTTVLLYWELFTSLAFEMLFEATANNEAAADEDVEDQVSQ